MPLTRKMSSKKKKAPVFTYYENAKSRHGMQDSSEASVMCDWCHTIDLSSCYGRKDDDRDMCEECFRTHKGVRGYGGDDMLKNVAATAITTFISTTLSADSTEDTARKILGAVMLAIKPGDGGDAVVLVRVVLTDTVEVEGCAVV